MKTPWIRVLLVDDHEVVREGIRQRLRAAGNIDVVAECGTADEAYRLCLDLLPDVVVLDLSLPGTGGLEAMRRMRARCRGVRILVFTIHDNRLLAERALQAGADGFVTKTAPLEELLQAVRRVAAGETVIESRMASKIALAQVRGTRTPLEVLSQREFEIFRMVANGRTTAEIAALFRLSPKTVSNHVSRLKVKLGVATAAELAHLAAAHGLVDPSRLRRPGGPVEPPDAERS